MGELTTRVVDPRALADADRERFVDEILPVFLTVFQNYDRPGVVRGLMADVYALVRVLVMSEPSGRAVGLALFRVHETEFEGRPIAAVRVGLGIERLHRGGAPFGSFLAAELVKYRLANPRREVYGFDYIVHPTSYLTVTKMVGEAWPHFERETPPAMLALATKLADTFGAKRVEGAHPLVRQGPAFTQDTDVERAYWQRSDRPDVQFFLRLNPGYHQGHCVATVFPLGVGAMLDGIARLGMRSLERHFEAAEAALQPFGLYTGVDEADAAASLARNPSFAELPRASVDRIAALAERRTVPAGRWLFRQGDPGDALYVVQKGQAFVLIDVGDEEPVVVDQLGPGDVFGEIALLLPQPRTASVRAVTSLELLRVRRERFKAMVADDPAIGSTLWRAVARRTARSRLVGSGRFAALSRDSREAWLDRVEHRAVAAGAEVTFEPGYVEVIDGAVEVTAGDRWWRLGGGSFVPVDAGTRATASADAQLAWLPARA